MKTNVDEVDDIDHKIDVEEEKKQNHVTRYANESVAIIGHRGNVRYTSKRIRKFNDGEDKNISNYYRRRRPDYDDEDESITGDIETWKYQRRSSKIYKANDNNIETFSVCGIQVPSQKIMNGTDVPPGKYPWIVSFKLKDRPNFCTGTIITSKYILTAAHCLEDLDVIDDKKCQTTKVPKSCFIKEEDMLIGLQDTKGLNLVEVKRNIPHPRYSAKTAVNDIALIQLKKSIKCSLLPKPLCLPHKDLSKEGQSLIIAGYGIHKIGVESTDKLMEGKVNQIPLKECFVDKTIQNKVLCARGAKSMQASCQGDSGSTLVKSLKNTFYGIGVTSVGPNDCSSEQGDTYTNVYKYLKWIKKHVKNLPKPKKFKWPVPKLSGSPYDADCRKCGIPPPIFMVMNGKKVKDPTKYPWIVSFIEKKNPKHLFCGGVLISLKFVITAGHCVDM
ncbi:unnamed protein product [Larinioides sclopetarius]|uniref:Peptidase S1 domain-containing protein n=1 Tax=Larinioides sclopetarius TaxID=280406 RepID=A0AAV1Z356_9ARAC